VTRPPRNSAIVTLMLNQLEGGLSLELSRRK
jgi:hypothetical protein